VNYVNGELIPSPGAAIFNRYRHATLKLGDAQQAKPWVDHVKKVLNKPGDADQFFNYMASIVQCPGVKLRFALLMGGEQGVGKDMAIEMCLPAIGAWNAGSIDPSALTNAFNEYVDNTLIRVSEAANAQDISRWALNEQLKVLIAGRPDICTVNSVPLNSTVLAVLERLPRRGEFVFTKPNGTPYRSTYGFYAARKLAGLRDVVPHTLRHTFATRVNETGADPRTLQELGGWSSLAMVQRYTHVRQTQKAEAVEKIARNSTTEQITTPERRRIVTG
jgi:hypothetical protein